MKIKKIFLINFLKDIKIKRIIRKFYKQFDFY
ncbi:hypothetical protein BAPKO_2532 (plasmid) [Borreliella afzelii PKo]|nr:hypothetical protein BAPKO_2532 [Borreliella afzelii PKo]